MEHKLTAVIPEKRCLKGTSLIGPESGPPSLVESNGDKIVRIRPFRYDTAYEAESLNPWSFEARGRTFSTSMKTVLSFVGMGYKKRVYSENRVCWPLKRVDWDPKGERNVQNRGKSKYVRISWDEAAQLVADELLRVKDKYGMSAVLSETDLHGEGKHLAPSHGCPNRLLSMLGGYTIQMRNEDSWEGWVWGSKHVWGCEPVGEMAPTANLYPDIARNSDLLLFWGCDPETTPQGIGCMFASRLCFWLSEIGLKCVYICPDLNYGAAVHADKWIPILPNTDTALQLAVAHTWLTEDTYEKDYIATHATGFDRFADYVLGREDGIPKTPAWASEKCGVPEWTIKALARDWAKKTASIIHGNGGCYIRGPYSTEPARLENILLGMRALGSPGVHQAKMLEWSLWQEYHPLPYRGKYTPRIPNFAEMVRPAGETGKSSFGCYSYPGRMTNTIVPELADILRPMETPPAQFIPKCLVHDAILKPSVTWYGNNVFNGNVKNQFIEFKFPADGCSRIHMIWSDSPCMSTCWNDGNAYLEAVRSPEIECMVAQHPWLENDCLMADIILPVQTKFEMDDIGDEHNSGTFISLYMEYQACPPVGESLSDFDAVAKIAEKLGQDYYDVYTGNASTEKKLELWFKASGIEKDISFEAFKEKQYFVVPCDPDVLKVPAGLNGFWKDPKNNPLSTPTGLLEITSTALEQYFPDDPERPPHPKWIEKGESHDERLSSVRANKYPLLCMSNHGHWRMHAQCDDITWTREIGTMKVRAKDGYQYEPVWLHPSTAEARGIQHGDIVKIFNERGIVLAGAYVTERLMPGVAYIDHGARLDPIDVGKIDRGGAINTITPHSNISKKATGMAVSGFLVDVQKVSDTEMDAWKKEFRDAFARKRDQATGVCLEGWLV